MVRLAARRPAAALFAGHDDDNITCVGAEAVGHASSNAVEPHAASRRRAARLRLFRARRPRAVSLDGVRRLVAVACRGRRRRSDRVLPKACGASLKSGTWSSTRLKSRKAVKSLSTACARSCSSCTPWPCRGARARAKKADVSWRGYSLFRCVEVEAASGDDVVAVVVAAEALVQVVGNGMPAR